MKLQFAAILLIPVALGCATRGEVRDLYARVRILDEEIAQAKATDEVLQAQQVAAVDKLNATDQVIKGEISSSSAELEAQVKTANEEELRRLTEARNSWENGDRAVSKRLDVMESQVHQRLAAIERTLDWSGAFQVKVDASRWSTAYANGTGRSQRVRIRAVGASPGLKVRVVPISKVPPGPLDAENPSESIAVEWDLSANGSQRWLRLMCGFEIQATSSGGQGDLRLLVSTDKDALSCDQ